MMEGAVTMSKCKHSKIYTLEGKNDESLLVGYCSSCTDKENYDYLENLTSFLFSSERTKVRLCRRKQKRLQNRWAVKKNRPSKSVNIDKLKMYTY